MAKWLSAEALQIAERRREAKGKGKKGLYTHLNAEFQRIARRDKKAFLSDRLMDLGLFFGNDIKRTMLTFFFLFTFNTLLPFSLVPLLGFPWSTSQPSIQFSSICLPPPFLQYQLKLPSLTLSSSQCYVS